MRLSLALVFVAGHAVADPRPTELSAKWADAETVHLAGDEGAINSRFDGRMTVKLLAKSKLSATDTGTRSEHNLYPSFSTDETTTWTNAWTGTWSTTTAGMQLDLVLATRACTKSKTTAGHTEKLACTPVTKQVRMDCETQAISVEDAAGVGKPADAWVCHPAATVELADTRARWVFGKTGCFETVGGHRRPASYHRC